MSTKPPVLIRKSLPDAIQYDMFQFNTNRDRLFTGRQDVRNLELYTGDIVKDKHGDYWVVALVPGGFALLSQTEGASRENGFEPMSLVECEEGEDVIKMFEIVKIGNTIMSTVNLLENEARLGV